MRCQKKFEEVNFWPGNLKCAPPLAIQDQLRHSTIKTAEEFYIGSDDIEYQREQGERFFGESGKKLETGKSAFVSY
jgi:hypothetical protein